jgi:Replication-relaxation
MLTERDKAVLRWIGANGVATTAQLTAKFWSNSNETNCLNRLRMMIKAGWLSSHYVDFDRQLRGLRVFCLTRAGAKQHFSAAEIATMMIGLPPRSTLKQQILAQQARLEIEKQLALQGYTLIEWQNESNLRSKFCNKKPFSQFNSLNTANITDAQIVVKDKKGNFNSLQIEIDGSYSRAMIARKLDEHCANGISIIWVTYSESRTKHLKQQIILRNSKSFVQVICVELINSK